MSALWLTTNTAPAADDAALARAPSPAIFSIGASSTFTSATRTACTLNSSGNVQPVSSYGVLLRIVRAPVLVVHQRVGDAAVRLIHADDVRAGGEGAARRLRPLGGAFALLSCSRRALGPPDRTCPPGPPAHPPLVVVVCLARRSSLAGHHHRERRRRARDLDALLLQHAQQFRLRAGTRIVGRSTRTPRALRSSPSGSSACS